MGERPVSSLLACAREEPALLVHLSPPLEPAPSSGSAAGLIAAGERAEDSAATEARGGAPPPDIRAAPPAGVLEPPLPVTSEVGPAPLTAPVPGESGERRERAVSERSTPLPSGERSEGPAEPPSDGGGASGTVSLSGMQPSGSGAGVRGGRVGVSVGDARRVSSPDDFDRLKTPRSSSKGPGRSGDLSHSRDIRDYFPV